MHALSGCIGNTKNKLKGEKNDQQKYIRKSIRWRRSTDLLFVLDRSRNSSIDIPPVFSIREDMMTKDQISRMIEADGGYYLDLIDELKERVERLENTEK